MIIQNIFKDNKRYIIFEGDEKEYEVDRYLANSEIMRKYGMPVPSGWFFWRNLFTSYKKEFEPEKSIITKEDIQFLIGRPVLHQYFADTKYYSADESVLVNSWRCGGVCKVEKYTFPDYDCDDFSFFGMGVWHNSITTARMATYVVWVSYTSGGGFHAHALNGFCKSTGFYLIDPQDCTYTPFTLPDSYEIMLLVG